MNRPATHFARLSLSPLRLERHRLGPRVYVFGARVHEYQLGFAITAGGLAGAGLAWAWTTVITLVGVVLVAKDWPDLFPATRDTARWRFGVHRLPRGDEPARERPTAADGAGEAPIRRYALAGRSQR